jgi:hypothetical protein
VSYYSDWRFCESTCLANACSVTSLQLLTVRSPGYLSNTMSRINHSRQTCSGSLRTRSSASRLLPRTKSACAPCPSFRDLFRSQTGCQTATADSIRADVIAGIAVAGLLVPEGMAYAGIAGVPPQMGLYAALAGMATYAIFGTSSAHHASSLSRRPHLQPPCWLLWSLRLRPGIQASTRCSHPPPR